MVFDGIVAPDTCTSTQSHQYFGCFPNALDALNVMPAHNAPFTEGNVEFGTFSGHHLPPGDDFQVSQQVEKGFVHSQYGQLAAFAAGKIKKGNSGLFLCFKNIM
jgi:hypothetical protein